MYSEKARELRRCTATKRDGERCGAWAVWDDPRRLCVSHAGRHHKGKMGVRRRKSERTRFVPCECAAYQWPHRPGGGLCRWPDPPLYRSRRPQGTRKYYVQVRRGSLAWKLRSLMRRPGEF